jgi:hypothetical protein
MLFISQFLEYDYKESFVLYLKIVFSNEDTITNLKFKWIKYFKIINLLFFNFKIKVRILLTSLFKIL